MSTDKDHKEKLLDQNNSPLQLISQIKGYFFINPFIAISLSITLFSFVGIPPVIGFFAKQMILSAALDSGYVFMSLVAILTSVIGAGYYLNLIKQIFFYKEDYKKYSSNTSDSIDKGYVGSSYVNSSYLVGYLSFYNSSRKASKFIFSTENITINSSLSTTISVLTLLLFLFIYTPVE